MLTKNDSHHVNIDLCFGLHTGLFHRNLDDGLHLLLVLSSFHHPIEAEHDKVHEELKDDHDEAEKDTAN